MLLMYNYVLLKMSTWCSKHVEESNNIWRINNFQCITLVVLYGQFMMHGQRNIKLSVRPAICLTAMYTVPVLMSTAPSMYSAHNNYQTHNLCPVATLLTPTTQQYICRTSNLFNSNVHFTSSMSTAPSMYSAPNQYQNHNLCPVTTLLTPTTQQYICRNSNLFNSNIHFISSTVNCTFNVLST